jgi:hypothetical protein
MHSDDLYEKVYQFLLKLKCDFNLGVTLPHKKNEPRSTITVFNNKTRLPPCFIGDAVYLSRVTIASLSQPYFIISNSNCLLLQYGENLKRLNKFIGETGYCSVVKQIKLSKDELPSMASFLNLAQSFPS